METAMLKFKCLVLDHDDTVVQSEKTLCYPFFCKTLAEYRPGCTITFEEYVTNCHHLGFTQMCKQLFQFTDQELAEEYASWKAYIETHIPDPYPGIREIIRKQKEAGGLICVVSHSGAETISRDYASHFGIQPDRIYGWDLPEEQRKPSPYPLLDIMQRYDLKPEELLVVDDIKLAWRMANPLGVKIAFAAWSKQEFAELAKEMTSLCDYTFSSTKELENFLFDSIDNYAIIPREI